jgi:hypothetical protein
VCENIDIQAFPCSILYQEKQMAQLKTKLRAMSYKELISEYTVAVRKTWEQPRKAGYHAGHCPFYQRELSLKRELLRRLSRPHVGLFG